MQTFDLFGRYIGALRVAAGTPLIHRAPLHELDAPYRTSRTLILRLYPLPYALAVGRWQHTGRTRGEMVEQLLHARSLPLHTEDGTLDPRWGGSARQTIAEHATDPDDEWQLLEMTGLDR